MKVVLEEFLLLLVCRELLPALVPICLLGPSRIRPVLSIAGLTLTNLGGGDLSLSGEYVHPLFG